jgi:ubiquinone/menaquinone biosynthesis C-methylase UbiE
MWATELGRVVTLPRARQYAALQQLRAQYSGVEREQWNTAFGPVSLYDAWTRLPLMQGLYRLNRAVVDEVLRDRPDWHIVEIGGGNGAIWDGFLGPRGPGTLALIDPHPDAHTAVAMRLPENVAFQSYVASVEHVDIPDADVIVCSLTLHHVAGVDAAQRRVFGLQGDGKAEILQRCIAAVQRKDGVGVLNEADVYNEIDLPPGDPVLIDHFIDVYVRRTACAVAQALEAADPDPHLREAWEAILRHWCLEQVDNAFLAIDQRDVYELDASRWVNLLQNAGAQEVTHSYTDEWNLFQQYIFR